jgi:hypothetical protein
VDDEKKQTKPLKNAETVAVVFNFLYIGDLDIIIVYLEYREIECFTAVLKVFPSNIHLFIQPNNVIISIEFAHHCHFRD